MLLTELLWESSIPNVWNIALRAHRNSRGLVRAWLNNTFPFAEIKSQSLTVQLSTNGAALNRDRALSKVGLPNQNIEKCGPALRRLLLNLSDDVAQPVLVLTPYEVALTAITVCHFVIICKK